MYVGPLNAQFRQRFSA
jgi:hypothetical protein